ncbi:MAG: hypothetical protein C5B49_13530 [Bdellovibrio sp.]|nr:MAG: hypothetical protein C5B49_13530 [Bdellovibrio sp.]
MISLGRLLNMTFLGASLILWRFDAHAVDELFPPPFSLAPPPLKSAKSSMRASDLGSPTAVPAIAPVADPAASPLTSFGSSRPPPVPAAPEAANHTANHTAAQPDPRDLFTTMSCETIEMPEFECYRNHMIEFGHFYIQRQGGQYNFGAHAIKIGKRESVWTGGGKCYRYVKQGDAGFDGHHCNYMGDYADESAHSAKQSLPLHADKIDLFNLNPDRLQPKVKERLLNAFKEIGIDRIDPAFQRGIIKQLLSQKPKDMVMRPFGAIYVYNDPGGGAGHIESKLNARTYTSDFRERDPWDFACQKYGMKRNLIAAFVPTEVFISAYKKFLNGQLEDSNYRKLCRTKLKHNLNYHIRDEDYKMDEANMKSELEKMNMAQSTPPLPVVPGMTAAGSR